MFRNARHRLITVLFVLSSLLFAQLALAVYVCPSSGANVFEASLPCAESMRMAADEAQPNLCHAHCQASQQKADSYQTPVLASLSHHGADYLVSLIPPSPPGETLQATLLSRTTAPPLAIQNCCLRI